MITHNKKRTGTAFRARTGMKKQSLGSFLTLDLVLHDGRPLYIWRAYDKRSDFHFSTIVIKNNNKDERKTVCHGWIFCVRLCFVPAYIK